MKCSVNLHWPSTKIKIILEQLVCNYYFGRGVDYVTVCLNVWRKKIENCEHLINFQTGNYEVRIKILQSKIMVVNNNTLIMWILLKTSDSI